MRRSILIGCLLAPVLALHVGDAAQTGNPTPADKQTLVPWSFRGNPSVQIAVRLGDLLNVELVHLHGSKRLSRDERPNVPVQMTPAGQPHLEPIEAVLPLLHVQVRAESVLKKQELSARL